MKVALVGLGTTGSHLARQLRSTDVDEVYLHDIDDRRVRQVRGAMDRRLKLVSAAPIASDLDDGETMITVLASPCGTHLEWAERMLRAGSHLVSMSDDPDEVEALLALDEVARDRDLSLVVGAGFCPGLSDVLVRYADEQLDSVEAISVAKAGTAGPACARQHHRSLKNMGRDWRDGEWQTRRGGSGRDLAWFPDPIGARDCYLGALASPILLQTRFPEANRISARLAATRRDRFTSWLPMLRKPHRDGGPGAIRAEVRGRVGNSVETLIFGVMDHPSVAAGTVAAVVAVWVGQGKAPVGAHGLVDWDNPKELLAELHRRGVKVASFSGQLSAL